MTEDARTSEEDKTSEDAILKEALKAFDLAEEAEKENRECALEDMRFSRLGEQWPADIVKQRKLDKRPVLTINKLSAFRDQVVNDARQNKPSMKVHPVDDSADVETADVINGLIRNIEYTSDADVAYDTGVECAVDAGVGYWYVDIDYAFDDTFDLDILIKEIRNPLSVFGDPFNPGADSKKWMRAFVIDQVSKEEFKEQYPDAECTDWDFDFQDVSPSWHDEETVTVADFWKREEIQKQIVLLSNGTVLPAEDLELPKNIEWMLAGDVKVVKSRVVKSHKVTRYKMTGAEILSVDDWPGKYIPIVPVYGEDFDIEGKRHLRSLIHDAKDAQRTFNFFRTTAAELTALSPRVPFIGPKGAFISDEAKWDTANQVSHSYVEYDVVTENGQVMPPPMRQQMDVGAATGALQEALNASDDMKSILGMYDAALGARSNEVSGRAIMARQREGDVSNFHFIDNLTRAIRHTGRIVIDLIPHIYSGERVVRVLGEDGSHMSQKINGPIPVMDDAGNPKMKPVFGPNGQPMIDPATGQPAMEVETRVFDLTAGKYDLIVNAGPSFTSRREEAAAQMTDMIRAYPGIAPIIGDLVAKNMDWPGADEIAKRLQKMLPPQLQGQQIPPQVKQQIEWGMQRIKQLEEENKAMKADKSLEAMKLRQDQVEGQMKNIVALLKAENDRFNAETKRVEVVNSAYQPQETMAPINPVNLGVMR
ncbi:portal protein [Roseibium sp.]|uniref:portal protein n=1 Tax=Roseibium sp. TaxID=1936156 RepID=UPI003B51E42E